MIESADGFAFADGDLEIFRLLHEYRLLRREHISLLTARPAKRLHRRLLKLVENGYIASIRLPQQKHIYGLGKLAIVSLVEHGLADAEHLGHRLRIHELKELFLKHEMMIVDLHVALSLALRGTDLRLVSWREGNELHDAIAVTDGHDTTRLPIRPDAFFTIEDTRRPAGANRVHFFLEADRSTETQTRFKEKIRGYWHYLEQRRHEKKFGIKSFRVLTVTISHERSQNLCSLAATASPERGRKHFLFTCLKNFSMENPSPILDTIYLSPRTADVTARYLLVPPLVSEKATEAMAAPGD